MQKQLKKEQQKIAEKEVSDWAKKNIEETGLHLESKKFETGKVSIYRSSIKSIAAHFTDSKLKLMAIDILEILKSIDLVGSKELIESKANFESKKKSGVNKFNYYEFEWKGNKYILNMKVINDEFEKPYAITTKK